MADRSPTAFFNDLAGLLEEYGAEIGWDRGSGLVVSLPGHRYDLGAIDAPTATFQAHMCEKEAIKNGEHEA